MRNIEAVFFDLDGTLLDRETSLVKFIEAQYDRFQIELQVIDKQVYKERFIELDARGYVWKDKVYSQLLQEFNIASLTWEELMEDYIMNFKHSCTGFNNLNEVVGKLKQMDLGLGIISNGKANFQMDNIKALGIEGYFDTILISEAVGLRKPDLRIFRKGIDALGVSAFGSIFVGDHPEYDVAASKCAGMIGIWKSNDYWHSAEADFIIKELEEFLGIIEKGAENHD